MPTDRRTASAAIHWQAADVDLAGYAALLGVEADRLLPRAGQRHDVVLDPVAGAAWRFPRTEAALEALPVSAARAGAAADVGLPAPEVLDVVLGPLGTARMGQRIVQGAGMSAALTDELGPRARTRLVRDLVAVLGGLRSVEPPAWPGGSTGWSRRWADLVARLRDDVLPLIPSPYGRRQALADLEAAQAAAEEAGPTGLTHGDLGGENVLVDPVVGAVVGILDWDDAAPGDPAVDLAAVLAHARPWLGEALLTADPSLKPLQDRAAAYLGTFALQQALWGVESGDAAEVEEGLAGYVG